jgi:hypothetical protein
MDRCECDCIGHEPGGRPVIQFCPLHAAAPAMLAALEIITGTTHHIALDGKGTHSATCPPCVASAAIAKAKGE